MATFRSLKEYIFFCAIALIVALNCGPADGAPPFMNIEGVGGAGIVPGAYLVNPPTEGKIVGKPAFSQWSIIGGENNIYTAGFAFSFAGHFELGYVLEYNDFRRLKRQLKRDSNGALDVEKPDIYMSNIHFKALLFKEKKYLPAFAVTSELKLNNTIEKMNRNIGRALDTVGYDDDTGVDFDFSISKMIKEFFFWPCIINANLRFTKGHYLGFLGFSSGYTANGEFSVCFMPTPKFAFGAEIREQTDEFDPLPMKGYSMAEEAFWDCFITIFPNKQFSIALAFCSYGNVVNKDINFFVCNLKYDF